MREIPLINGGVTIVDDDDYEWLSRWRWNRWERRGNQYALCCSGHQRLPMHRLILAAPTGMEVDHINHDGLDNRRVNLRLCTRAQNQYNQRVQVRPKASRFKGVRRGYKGKWVAVITCQGAAEHLGSFEDEVDAAQAYDEAARRHFGQFAHTNLIAGKESG
jgi:hypothetical protein